MFVVILLSKYEKKIVAIMTMPLPKMGGKKILFVVIALLKQEGKKNFVCGNVIAEIWGKNNKK